MSDSEEEKGEMPMMTTRWSKPGQQKGRVTSKRGPTLDELKALVRMAKKQGRRLKSVEISLIYRFVFSYKGKKTDCDDLMQMLPKLEEDQEWKLSDGKKNLQDLHDVIGVPFASPQEIDEFTAYLAKQDHPHCLDQFLAYADAYKKGQARKKKQREAKQEALKKMAAAAASTPPKKTTKCKLVSEEGVASKPIDVDQDDKPMGFMEYMAASYDVYQEMQAKKKKGPFKTDKSDPDA